MNYGLALSGGGTRGATHLGILKALSEENLLPDSMAGTSAGSIVAGLYSSKMTICEMCKLVKDLSKHGFSLLDPDYLGLLRFIPQMLIGKEVSLTGLVKGQKLLKLLCNLTNGIHISDLPNKLVIPAVDIKSGYTIAFTNASFVSPMENVIWKHDGRLCDIMMASSSIPGIFRPRKLEHYCLIDGGVSNNLPVNLLIATGQKRVIAVDIGVDYETPHNHSITEIVSHSFSIMSHDLKNCMSQGELLLLKPKLKKGAGLLTFNDMNECLNEGYIYAKKMMPQIKRLLG